MIRRSREAGQAIVVFEAGATSSLEAWRSVVHQFAGTTPFIAYDCSGLGESTWDEQTPAPKHVSDRLRRLLREIGADPPYLLVGHSWGGGLMRSFAGYYPDDVAGIVYVDPGPIVTQSVEDELAPFEAIGAGRAEYEAFWSGYESVIARSSPAVRAEFEVYRNLMRRDVAERNLRPPPDVPVVVIVAAKPYPPLPGLPFDAQRHFRADLRHRLAQLQDWALASRHGTIVVTNHASHAVPRDDPDLIVWAVQRVLTAIDK
jgi:pimeloyl-ACP methyl ester carboxylesterase